METVKKRETNLELYRIIVMILIVAHHYVVSSGLLNIVGQNPTSAQSIYLYFLGMWGKTAINCFVLITGYFMCKSRITMRKFTKLILWVLFYNIVIYSLFVLFGYEEFTVKRFFSSTLPITSLTTGFTSCFLVFWLFIPFLNILINSLNHHQHATLILLCLFFFSIWPQIHYTVNINYVTWFSILYLVASFIRNYGINNSIPHKLWGWGTLVTIVLAMGSVLIQLYFGKNDPYRFVSDSNAIYAVMVSVCSFMYFKDVPLKYNKIFNAIGGSTFGVFLIHSNGELMSRWLWNDLLDNVGHYAGNIYLHSLICVVAIFIICTFIDQLRLKFVEKPLFDFLDKYMKKRGNKFIFNWT